jgi:GNAT superfamily N-acetyltransferase
VFANAEGGATRASFRVFHFGGLIDCQPSAMKISYLADTAELASQLIPGLLDHWRPLVPEDTAEARLQRFQAHLNRDTLPIAWLAHEAGQAIGTASLRASDLPGREELSPWLGGVYVAPAFRGRGIASALCRTVEERAAALGHDRLYLFTLDQQALYQHLGWRAIERTSWRGRAIDLMVKALDGPNPGQSR